VDVISALFGGFVRIFLVSLILWMLGLLVLLFREIFNAGQFDIRDYFYKVWRLSLLIFEVVGYGAVIVGPIMMFRTEEYLTYGMMTLDAVLLSLVYLYLRRSTGGWSRGKMRMRRERGSRR